MAFKNINKKNIIKLILIYIFCLIFVNLYSQENNNQKNNNKDQTSDIKKIDQKMDVNNDSTSKENELKRLPVVFDYGGAIYFTSRVLFNYFRIVPVDGGIEPIPNDQWYCDATGKFWGRMSFQEESFIHIGVITLLKVQRNDYGYNNNSVVPLINIDEFYLNWKYLFGRIIFGRTNYNLKANLIFNGPLDGFEMDINIPFFNFKSFIGYSGFLGLFNPWFNPYSVTSTDRLYQEESNLLFSKLSVKINSDQARRIFFANDFDIYFFGQHINPYILLQYDLSSLFYNLNQNLNVNTIHLGINFEGRIITDLYYKIHLSGLFGSHPSSEPGVSKPILACAFESKLRYTVQQAKNSTFILGYAFGTGNSESFGEWSDYSDDEDEGFWSDRYDGNSQNKFFYYGKYDGGYVLNPVLSNIHSISFKYIISPYEKGLTHISLYAAFYQTLKFWPTGPISDDKCRNNNYIVGSEIDIGLMANIGAYFNFGIDCGIFIPETAYDDRSLRFKLGATIGFTF